MFLYCTEDDLNEIIPFLLTLNHSYNLIAHFCDFLRVKDEEAAHVNETIV